MECTIKCSYKVNVRFVGKFFGFTPWQGVVAVCACVRA